jgi:SAM-dependent methyltransferase
MSEEKETLPPRYFDDVYAASADPWNFETSEYEAAKYAATLDALPRENYQSVFEIGCSIGVLTFQLAPRCGKLLSVDVSAAALSKARERCRAFSNVDFKLMQIPAQFPAEKFDLILVSEVGYYLSPADWQTATNKIINHLLPKGNVVLVHWTPFVHDYPQTGDAVHDSFRKWTADALQLTTARREETYRLDVYEKF